MIQIVSPDDEHDVLETCRELKIKINTQKGICASRLSFTKNHYMMHGQQNIKFLHVSCLGQLLVVDVGRDSSVGVATRYLLDCPEIECWWGRDFPHLSRPALGPNQPPIQWVTGSYLGLNRPERGADHPPHLAPRLKKEQSCTCILPLDLRGLFQSELYLFTYQWCTVVNTAVNLRIS